MARALRPAEAVGGGVGAFGALGRSFAVGDCGCSARRATAEGSTLEAWREASLRAEAESSARDAQDRGRRPEGTRGGRGAVGAQAVGTGGRRVAAIRAAGCR